MAELSKVGKRGAVVIPAALRRRFGIKEGSLVIAEAQDGWVFRYSLLNPFLTIFRVVGEGNSFWLDEFQRHGHVLIFSTFDPSDTQRELI